MVPRRKQFDKQPTEEYPIDINFGSALPLGATYIQSATCSARKWPRRFPTQKIDATLEVLFSTDAIIIEPHKTRARIFVKGGDDDFEYQITVLATFDNGAILEEELFMRVRED